MSNLTHSCGPDSRIEVEPLTGHFLPNLPRSGGVFFDALVAQTGAAYLNLVTSIVSLPHFGQLKVHSSWSGLPCR